MEPSSMELKVMSCRGLRAFNFFQKLCVYVMVSIVCADPSGKQKKRHHQQQKTPIDREGDGDPEWKHEMRFDLKEIQSSSSSSDHYDHLFLEFDLLCEGMILGDKRIGKVRVPFKELIEEFSGGVRFVSYQVQSTDGKPNGVLNFAYKVIGKENKIGNGFTVIDNNNSPIVNPASSVSYPTVDVHNPSPAVYYPSAAEVHNPSMEVFYLAPPPPPPPPPPHVTEMVYYYHHPPQPVYYPPPPAPYGYEMGGYRNPQFGYPTVGQPHQPYGDTWHNGWQQREGSAGSWSFR